jgi:serine/threonine-protein kinase
MTDRSSPPGEAPVKPGDTLAGKFRVDQVLGVGGMGIVVAATHLHLHQKVAIKFMLEGALVRPALVERFAREARAAARLRSDHIARVLDVGTLANGSPYIVMEYLEGSDLGALLEERGCLSIEETVDFVLQTCDALAEAHSIGIVHRDLKPRNLFVTARNDGRALVKVLDFGISKHKTGASDMSLTRTSEIMGSPNYMSPEQFRSSKSVDERSDIWALGAIVYELLAGRVPFVADSVTALTALVLMEPPTPLSTLRPNLPARLVGVVERCLQKDPALRFQSVAQLALALKPFAPGESRELADRIARIGAGAGTLVQSVERVATEGATGATGTNGNWTNKASSASASGKRLLAIVAVGVVAVAAAGIVVTRTARPPGETPTLTSLHAVTPPTVPEGTLPPLPAALVAEPPPTLSFADAGLNAAAPSSGVHPAAKPAPAHVPGRPAPEPSSRPGDIAKYRTTW